MTSIADMNTLYDAYKASRKSSPWKPETQKFGASLLHNLTQLCRELETGTYKTSTGSEFVLRERGKIRHVHGNRMKDKIVRRALCDTILSPDLEPYMIYANGASQKGKGPDFSRSLFEKHLHNYWLKYRSNTGWVLFGDFSKYYDNIQHEKAISAIAFRIEPDSVWLLQEAFENFRIDVSYMTDEEYKNCLSNKFVSLDYYANIPKEMHTGEKYMAKSVDIGDQVSQNVGIYYPTPIDNYVTIVRGHRYYGRYMDDFYIIGDSKEYLQETLRGIKAIAEDLGIFINEKKTRIIPLSSRFTFLQMKYWLTESGRVVKRINPKAVTRERRKLKAYRRLLDNQRMIYEEIENAYKSWMGRYYKVMSRKQVKNMQLLYQELFDGRNPRWKKKSIQ